MAQYRWFNQHKSLQPELCRLDGYIATDGYGAVLNTSSAATAPLDVFGLPLLFPRGVASVAEDGSVAGLYHIVLEQPFYRLEAAHLQPVSSAVKAGTMKVVKWNVNNSTPTNSAAALTIDVQFEQSGSAAHLTSGGFFLSLILKNINI